MGRDGEAILGGCLTSFLGGATEYLVDGATLAVEQTLTGAGRMALRVHTR